MSLAQFFEERIGLTTFWRASMSEKRPPRGIGFLRTLGFCALTVAMVQLLTGIALAFHYVPSTDLAYDSILSIEQEVPLGRFTRALHHFGASAFVILVVLHLARVFFTGAYKRPRELTWVTGVGLLLIVLGFGFTGYLLPWDQKAYFATKVGTEIAGKAPVLGAFAKEALNGGEAVGAPTLTRFYVIHVVILPLSLLGLLGLHLFLVQRHGVAPPGLPVGETGEPGPPYFPDHVLKEAIAGLVVAALLVGIAATYSAPLEALADPADTGYDPRPDWYFLGLFELLKIFQGPYELIGTVVLPGVGVAGLLLLPFLDRSPHRHWRRRPFVVAVGAAVLLGAVGLTVSGATDAPTNDPTLRHELGLTPTQREGYLLVRRLKCIECHALPREDGSTLGGSDDYPDAPYLDELDYEPEDMAALLEDPAEMLSPDTEMPDFAHVPYEQRRAVAMYLQTLVQ